MVAHHHHRSPRRSDDMARNWFVDSVQRSRSNNFTSDLNQTWLHLIIYTFQKFGWQLFAFHFFHISSDSFVCRDSFVKPIVTAKSVARLPPSRECLVFTSTLRATEMALFTSRSPPTPPTSIVTLLRNSIRWIVYCFLIKGTRDSILYSHPSISRASSVVSPDSSGLPPNPTVFLHCCASHSEQASSIASRALLFWLYITSHA